MKLFFKIMITFGNRPIHLCVLYHKHVTSLQKITTFYFLSPSAKLPRIEEKLSGFCFISYMTKVITIMYLLLILCIYI